MGPTHVLITCPRRHSAMSALGNRHSLARSSVSVPESAINLPSSPTGRRMIL